MLDWLLKKSRPELAKLSMSIVLLIGFIFSFYFWHLGTQPAGLSPSEVSARSASSTIHSILMSPLYAPHKLLQSASSHIFHSTPFMLRASSAVLAIIFIFCFYFLIKGWFGKMIGFIATLFLASTPWFVLLARNAGPEISLFAPIALLASYYWLVRSKSKTAWLCLLISGVLVVYLPGGLWLILLGVLFARDSLKRSIDDLKLAVKILAVFVIVLILAPLVYAGLKNPSAIKLLLLIPTNWPSPLSGIKSVAWDILAIFWRTPVHADFLIGRLPMVSGAQIVLALFGGFALFRLAKTKLYLVVGWFAFGIVAAALNRNLLLLSLALPAITLAIAAGLRYLYMEWRLVFPKNPLPKYLALSLIFSLTFFNIYYGWHYALAAWPNTSATRATYVLK